MNDAYGLIDYNSKDLTEESFTIKNKGLICRLNDTIQFVNLEKDPNFNSIFSEEQLIKINIDSLNNFQLIFDQYELNEKDNFSSPNIAWFILRKKYFSDHMNSYCLNEGDILKIGRITTRIRTIKFKKYDDYLNMSIHTEINIKENKNNGILIKENKKKENNKILTKEKSKNTISEKSTNKICRICYNEEENSDNPLVRPCSCIGSLKYIHLNCLKQWLNAGSFHLIDHNDDCYLFSFKQAECELCKTKLPDFIKHKGKLYEIIDFHNDVNFQNYFILESLTIDKNENRYIYVVSLDNNCNTINIGRGREANLLLSDISVSRLHCFLTIDRKTKKIYLHDSNSKFGTLVLIQTPIIKLAQNMEFHVQIGRTFLEAIKIKPSNIFCCCETGEKLNEDIYFKQNEEKIDKFKKLIVKNEDEDENSLKNNEEKNNEEITINLKNLDNNKDIFLENINEGNNLLTLRANKKEERGHLNRQTDVLNTEIINIISNSRSDNNAE